MFENLRQQSAQELPEEEPMGGGGMPTMQLRQNGKILGMTPVQLAILSFMLFLNVSVLGCGALVVFGRIKLF